MVRPERFELPASWFVARRSIQLSYGRILSKSVALHGGEGGIARGRGRSSRRFRSGPPSLTLRRRPSSTHLTPRHTSTELTVSDFKPIGGEGGIRTLDGLLTHTPLAGARLRPLGHLSGSGNEP